MPSQPHDVFVTGATGLLGRWLVPELTRRGARVLALVRNAGRRERELRSWLAAHGGEPSQVDFVEGDLDLPALGLDTAALAQLRGVRHAFHLGASFAWGLTPEAAYRTNVTGTLQLLEFVASLPAFEHFVFVGGYRSVERIAPDGRRYLPDARESARAGAYEASRMASIRAVRQCARELGISYSMLHPSSVIGDSHSGETTQVIGLGETILALARGQLPARVGGPRTFVPLVTVDVVARVLVEMASDRSLYGEELTLLDPQTPELDRLIDRAALLLGVPAPRLRLPLWFVRRLPERITRTSPEALSFLDDARYCTEATDRWLASRDIVYPDIEAAFDRWVVALAQMSEEVALDAAERQPGSA